MTDRVLYELEKAGYVEATVANDSSWGGVICKLTPLGLQLVAGWPSTTGDAAVAKLFALVDRRIVEAETAEERSRWQRVRDGLLSFGRDALVEVLGAAAGTAAGSSAG